jgi:hypothetical protein
VFVYILALCPFCDTVETGQFIGGVGVE